MLDAAPDRQIPVMFKEASLEADEATQTYAITFSFDTPKGLTILPGMNAVVWFKEPKQIKRKSQQVISPTDGNCD